MSDISVIVCGHNEGRLLHRTLNSVFRAMNYALTKAPLDIEVILSLDSPTRDTLEYLETSKYVKQIDIYKNNFKDVALSRNFAVKKAHGKYIAFIDGDDLMCSKWLYKAYQVGESFTDYNNYILHPEYLINFEEKSLIWKRLSSDDSNFRYGTLLYANCWDFTCFMPRALAIKYPFTACPDDSGWGMEDYHFFLETLADGIKQIIVHRTVVFVRVKKTGSRLAQHVNSSSIVKKTKLFNPVILKQYISHISEDVGSTSSILPRGKNLKQKILEPFPKLHLFLYRVKQYLLRNFRNDSGSIEKKELPEWLLSEWRSINEIEPQLFPSIQTLSELPSYDLVYSDSLANEYINLCEQLGNDVYHLILVPFIKVGGAEKVLFNFIATLQSLYPSEKIAVISTESSDSPWRDKLPKDVPFIDLGNMNSVSYNNKELLLQKIIVQLEPKQVYNISSQLGFITFAKYGKALSKVSNLYAFVFCQEYDREGELQGYAFLYLNRCIDSLTKVFTDNQRYINLLCNIYGFDKRKFVPLYQPVETLDISKKKYSQNGDLKLLWAGRLDRQKHPEIALEIAKQCIDLNVQIDLYGSKVLDDYFDLSKLNKLPNIRYCGTFSNGLVEIAKNYDGFIYTSEYDGMPNIILEAIGVGLPIISSNVGGIGDLLEDRKSGLLVSQFDDINEYREKIKFALENRQEFNEYAKVAFSTMLKKHNWNNLKRAIMKNISK